MIRLEDVREWLDKRPFKPFHIRLQDGRSFKIGKLHKCIVGMRAVYVGVPDPRRRGVALDTHHVALVHVVRFEPLNGKRRGTSRRKNGRAT